MNMLDNKGPIGDATGTSEVTLYSTELCLFTRTCKYLSDKYDRNEFKASSETPVLQVLRYCQCRKIRFHNIALSVSMGEGQHSGCEFQVITFLVLNELPKL